MSEFNGRRSNFVRGASVAAVAVARAVAASVQARTFPTIRGGEVTAGGTGRAFPAGLEYSF